MIMKKSLCFLGMAVLFFACRSGQSGQEGTQHTGQEKPELTGQIEPDLTDQEQMELTDQERKMEWWRDARFGMFIHWGLYAIPAGEWNGEKISGISEWIMARAEIPVAEYEKLAAEFDPVKYDAEEWVLLAKNAGMKYIVITSKHHDGFAMYQSQASPYNIVDATPFGRDPLKELADACEKHDMRLGFYYSQAQDWHEPGGTYWNIEQGEPHWDPALEREPLMNYIEGKAVPQVREILENYGGLDILWWDTPRGMTEEAALRLRKEADKFPMMLQNNRLYRPWPGDFSTPEQHVPPTGLDYDWEVCMTMNTSWGYKHYDHNWKSAETLIRMLVDIASKGGNLLLNVGPDALGEIPQPSVERLREIGEWMDVNGESIYGTEASPFFKLPWGRCTRRDMEDGTLLYLHLFDWPEDGILEVPGLSSGVRKAYLLSDRNRKFNTRKSGNDLLIELKGEAPDPANSVVVLEIRGEPEVISNMPAPEEGEIILTAEFADIHNPGYGTHAQLSGKGDEAVITGWSDPRARLEWMFRQFEGAAYSVKAYLRTDSENRLTIEVAGQVIEAEITSTGGAFREISLGEIELPEEGEFILTLKPVRERWNGLDLSRVVLQKK